MQVSAPHSTSHYLPVQPTPPVQPVKPKSEPPEGAPKVKAATPPHVGKTLDIHA